MSSTTITCQNDTYLYLGSQNANYSSATKLKSKTWEKDDTTFYIPIFQFSIPENLVYKKISKVTIQYKIEVTNNIAGTWGAYFRAFSADQMVDTVITYANQYNYGVYTEPIEFSRQVTLAEEGGGYPNPSTTTVSADITSLFSNNVNNNIFSIAINVITTSNDVVIWAYGTSSPVTLTIEYEDVLPGEPIIIYPVDAYVSQDQPIRFSWAHNTESGAYQNAYELQWKKSNEESWTNLAIGTGTQNSYTAAADTFPTGIINWRVRTTDILGQVSDYSTASFIVKGKPLAPIISETKNDALTEIKWSSSEQVVYESELYKDGVRLLNDAKSTEENSYNPLMFLADGTYEFRIRIMNVYNIWSDWTSKIFTISTTKPSKPTISVSLNGYCVKIVIDTPGYIYRIEDGKETLIALSEAGTYEDYEIICNKRTGYFVRSYNVGYTDSDITYVTANFDGFIVTNGIDSVQITESIETFIPFYEESSKTSELIYYSGREYPIMETGEFSERIIRRTCSIDEEQYKKLLKIYYSDLDIIYKDNRGCIMSCQMSKPNRTNSFVFDKYTTEIAFTQIYRKGVSIDEES